MFSSSKKVNEQQLVNEVKGLLGKHVMKHSRQAEALSNSNSSLFMMYVYIYIYIAQQEIWDKCGLLKGLSAGNLLINSLIRDVAKGANPQDADATEKQQRKIYEKVSDRLHKANASKGNNDFDIDTVAHEAMMLVAEKITGKNFSQLQSEGFDGLGKFLVVTKHCIDFDREVSKLLSKRVLV